MTSYVKVMTKHFDAALLQFVIRIEIEEGRERSKGN